MCVCVCVSGLFWFISVDAVLSSFCLFYAKGRRSCFLHVCVCVQSDVEVDVVVKR